MSLRRYFGTSFLSAVLFLASGIPALAGSHPKGAKRMFFSYDFMVNGKAIPAGRYSVRWQTHSPEATVAFVQKHTTLASTDARVEQRAKVYAQNEVVYNTAKDGAWSLVEIRFAGSKDVIVFNR